ncbi:dienelactone hydrolase family protein [Solimonas sp. K1W22B-7]|uniref:dienelactone hydrolase family protein n=1 Tax=Solimonas sp. K1W22B-7 TaxID=2303331 RepID=UPI000E3329AA|nr:dienelactone hydrolase family protein [Solimonas sp. K1W22B-7]AXQ30144.1 dienelactone hydrolase family protein [Solimonas sp. K1W22B-7]
MDLDEYGLKPLDFSGARPAVEKSGFTRRGFLVSTLASGFALASSPVLAQAIRTDSKGLLAGAISIDVPDGKMPAYRARPARRGHYPVVLVIQEIFGVHEHIQDVCRRLAKLGYCAIAPELFARQGDVSKMSDIGQILQQVVAKVPDAQVMSDLDATVAHAGKSEGADTARVGIVGFCWGGRTTWLYAAHNPKVKAGVAYYGLLSGMKSEIKPQDPIDIGATLKVPVLGLYAAGDAYIPLDVVNQMQKETVKSGSGSEIVVFPGVDHGFNADYRPTYDATAATYGWKLARDWFKEHGV